jgi:hypothetical protein
MGRTAMSLARVVLASEAPEAPELRLDLGPLDPGRRHAVAIHAAAVYPWFGSP